MARTLGSLALDVALHNGLPHSARPKSVARPLNSNVRPSGSNGASGSFQGPRSQGAEFGHLRSPSSGGQPISIQSQQPDRQPAKSRSTDDIRQTYPERSDPEWSASDQAPPSLSGDTSKSVPVPPQRGGGGRAESGEETVCGDTTATNECKSTASVSPATTVCDASLKSSHINHGPAAPASLGVGPIVGEGMCRGQGVGTKSHIQIPAEQMVTGNDSPIVIPAAPKLKGPQGRAGGLGKRPAPACQHRSEIVTHESAPKRRRCSIGEAQVAVLLRRYSAPLVMALLREIARAAAVDMHWEGVWKRAAPGLGSQRECQAIWRHLAYHSNLDPYYVTGAMPLEDESDLEEELEPPAGAKPEAVIEAAACVKADMQRFGITQAAVAAADAGGSARPSKASSLLGGSQGQATVGNKKAVVGSHQLVVPSRSPGGGGGYAAAAAAETPACDVAVSTSARTAACGSPPVSTSPRRSWPPSPPSSSSPSFRSPHHHHQQQQSQQQHHGHTSLQPPGGGSASSISMSMGGSEDRLAAGTTSTNGRGGGKESKKQSAAATAAAAGGGGVKRKANPWGSHDDVALKAAVEMWGEGQWSRISQECAALLERTPSQLAQRWGQIRRRLEKEAIRLSSLRAPLPLPPPPPQQQQQQQPPQQRRLSPAAAAPFGATKGAVPGPSPPLVYPEPAAAAADVASAKCSSSSSSLPTMHKATPASASASASAAGIAAVHCPPPHADNGIAASAPASATGSAAQDDLPAVGVMLQPSGHAAAAARPQAVLHPHPHAQQTKHAMKMQQQQQQQGGPHRAASAVGAPSTATATTTTTAATTWSGAKVEPSMRGASAPPRQGAPAAAGGGGGAGGRQPAPPQYTGMRSVVTGGAPPAAQYRLVAPGAVVMTTAQAQAASVGGYDVWQAAALPAGAAVSAGLSYSSNGGRVHKGGASRGPDPAVQAAAVAAGARIAHSCSTSSLPASGNTPAGNMRPGGGISPAAPPLHHHYGALGDPAPIVHYIRTGTGTGTSPGPGPCPSPGGAGAARPAKSVPRSPMGGGLGTKRDLSSSSSARAPSPSPHPLAHPHPHPHPHARGANGTSSPSNTTTQGGVSAWQQSSPGASAVQMPPFASSSAAVLQVLPSPLATAAVPITASLQLDQQQGQRAAMSSSRAGVGGGSGSGSEESGELERRSRAPAAAGGSSSMPESGSSAPPTAAAAVVTSSGGKASQDAAAVLPRAATIPGAAETGHLQPEEAKSPRLLRDQSVSAHAPPPPPLPGGVEQQEAAAGIQSNQSGGLNLEDATCLPLPTSNGTQPCTPLSSVATQAVAS
eukprot:jgi/Mesen1/8868/ME000530S08286